MDKETSEQKYNKRISGVIDKNDLILLKVLVDKFNDENKMQPRFLYITEKFIYNIKPHSLFGGVIAKFKPETRIKRKISLINLYGITISKTSKEFVIHVYGEYDYRYQSDKERDQIIEKLCFIYQKILGYKMPIYFKDDMTLIQFTTSKQDFQKGIVRIPKEQPQCMDVEEYKRVNTSEMIYAQDFKQQKKIVLEDLIPLKVLGRGAFGKVMLCRDQSTNKIYAIKSLQKIKIIGNGQVDHVKTEREILCTINHPFLIKLKFAFQNPEKLFFVFPFIGGGELFQLLIKFRKLPEDIVLFYVTQVVMGIGHLHQFGFVYRDLKPENILICEDGYIKIVDFGLCKKLSNGQKTKSFVGTLDYIAPEICSYKGHDFIADWWSVGILIYELLVGFAPFQSNRNDQRETIKNIINLQPVFPQNVKISAECQDLILKLLTKNPSDRLGSEKEILSHPWFQQINQDLLLQKKLKAPYIPEFKGETDVNNFSSEFTQENACFSMVSQKINAISGTDDQFRQMSYYQEDLQEK